MGLAFAGATSRRIVVAADSSINGLGTWSALFSFYPTATTASRFIMDKEPNSSPFLGPVINLHWDGNGGIVVQVGRNGANDFAESQTDGQIVINAWNWLAVTYDENGSNSGITIYLATSANGAMTSRTISYQETGSGTHAETTELTFFNEVGGGSQFPGHGGRAMFFDDVLTLKHLEGFRRRPRVASALKCWIECINTDTGTDALRDLSGNKNHGTLFGATAERHMPACLWWPGGNNPIRRPDAVPLLGIRNETLNLSEGSLRNLGLTRLRDETVQLSEQELRNLGITRVIDEDVQLAEDTPRSLGLVRQRDTTAQLTEAVLAGLGIIRGRDETVNLTEGTASVLGLLRQRDETEQLSEDTDAVLGLLRQRDEMTDLSENTTNVLGLLRSRAETLNLSDGVSRFLGLNRVRNATLQLAESVLTAAGYIRIQDDTLQISEGLARALGYVRTQDETLSLNEAVGAHRGIVVVRSETLNLTETVASIVAVAVLGFVLGAIKLFPALESTIGLDAAARARLGLGPRADGDITLDPGDHP